MDIRHIDPNDSMSNGSDEITFDALIGTVTKIIPRDGPDSELSDHRVNVDVGLESEERRVPVLPFATGGIYVPEVGDDVLVYYMGDDTTSPIVISPINTLTDEAPIGDPGDYRVRQHDDAEFEIYKNDDGESVASLARKPDEGGEAEMGLELNLATEEAKLGRFDDATVEVVEENDDTIIRATKQPGDGGDPSMGLEMNLSTDEVTLGHFDNATVEVLEEGGNTIIRATKKPPGGGTPSMGLELNLTTGEIKIGDGEGYGITSDGKGNFKWYIQSLDYVSDGSTLSW